jgi:hypothetical protein
MELKNPVSTCIGVLFASMVVIALGLDEEIGTQIGLSNAVAQLVDDTTRKDTEATAFRALQDLGDDAVPFIVSHLGDFRPYRNRKSVFKIARRMLANPQSTTARSLYTTPSKQFCGK